jgi:MFS family permease
MFAPSVPEVMRGFGVTNADLGTLVVSIYVLGFAVGPVVVAPMSEIFGRLPMYLISNLMFVIFTTACAVSSSLGMLTGFRFLAGCAGAAPIALGGASIGDMFPRDRRGAAMAVWGMGPMLGL